MSFFFFFQAEDGIRDGTVTGVQTCALPICCAPYPLRSTESRSTTRISLTCRHSTAARGCVAKLPTRAVPPSRSEERRVGKECRSGRSPYCEIIYEEMASVYMELIYHR